MSGRRLALASLVSFAIAGAMASVRAECATPGIDEEFHLSSAVFLGLATDQSVLTDARPWYTETTFEVRRVWKGKPDADKRLRVRTCGGVVGDRDMGCGESVRFVPGTEYVVWADGDPLMTNTCHHTAAAWTDEAKKTLRWLGAKASRRLQ
jgi:hypothetical protein